MAETYNVQDWIKGDMHSFTISDNGNAQTGRDPMVIAEVFVNEDLGQSQDEAEDGAARLAKLFALSPRMLEVIRLCERALEERDTEAEEHAAKQARAILTELSLDDK